MNSKSSFLPSNRVIFCTLILGIAVAVFLECTDNDKIPNISINVILEYILFTSFVVFIAFMLMLIVHNILRLTISSIKHIRKLKNTSDIRTLL